MNRRDFLRRAAIVTGAGLVADKLDLLERLAPRSLFASIELPKMATVSFTQTNARYGFDGYYFVDEIGRSHRLEAIASSGRENRIPLEKWPLGLADVQVYSSVHDLKLSPGPGTLMSAEEKAAFISQLGEWGDIDVASSVHELRTFTVPEWRAGWPTQYRRRRREPRFVRELRALVESPLPDVALDPRRRPRFMREFDRLWQNGHG